MYEFKRFLKHYHASKSTVTSCSSIFRCAVWTSSASRRIFSSDCLTNVKSEWRRPSQLWGWVSVRYAIDQLRVDAMLDSKVTKRVASCFWIVMSSLEIGFVWKRSLSMTFGSAAWPRISAMTFAVDPCAHPACCWMLLSRSCVSYSTWRWACRRGLSAK